MYNMQVVKKTFPTDHFRLHEDLVETLTTTTTTTTTTTNKQTN